MLELSKIPQVMLTVVQSLKTKIEDERNYSNPVSTNIVQSNWAQNIKTFKNRRLNSGVKWTRKKVAPALHSLFLLSPTIREIILWSGNSRQRHKEAERGGDISSQALWLSPCPGRPATLRRNGANLCVSSARIVCCRQAGFMKVEPVLAVSVLCWEGLCTWLNAMLSPS